MSTLPKCEKILKSGKQCSRNAQFNSDYCWQHIEQKLSIGSPNNKKSQISPSTYFKEIGQLPIDITKNILSDYIDYDTLTEIIKYSEDFKVNPNRIEIKETNKDNNKIKEIYIDGDLRKIEIFNKDNIKIFEYNFKNGKLEGKQYDWYIDGQLKSEENYKNGKLEDKQHAWNENGRLQYEKNYKNGEYEGKQYFWYKNGQLKVENNYKNEKREGAQYGWYENGQLHYDSNYVNGKPEGVQYSWYKNGQLESEYNYKNGKAKGLQYSWSEDGKLQFEKNYKDGVQENNT
jgi:antitoxin component YwqK of YwqJK toxin-antitoxin module